MVLGKRYTPQETNYNRFPKQDVAGSSPVYRSIFNLRGLTGVLRNVTQIPAVSAEQMPSKTRQDNHLQPNTRLAYAGGVTRRSFGMCVMGPVSTPGKNAGRRILVHGHRGARAVRPENTMVAFKYAIDAGADAIELDLAVTRDNVVVVSHDPVLHLPVCTGPRPEATIRQLELAEVRQWDCGAKPNPEFPRQRLAPGSRIPTLDEVLDLAPRGHFDFNLEAKIYPDRPELTPSPEEFARLVVESVRRRGLEERAILQSFDFRVLRAMMALDPEIRRAGLHHGPARDFREIAKEAGAGIVAPEKALITEARVRAAREAGLQVIPWTANTPEEWDRLAAAGVDAIITDDPAALLGFLRERGLH